MIAATTLGVAQGVEVLGELGDGGEGGVNGRAHGMQGCATARPLWGGLGGRGRGLVVGGGGGGGRLVLLQQRLSIGLLLLCSQ